MTAMAEALRAGAVTWADFVEIEGNPEIRAWSGLYDLSVEGRTWKGVAVAGSVSRIRVTAGTELNGFQIGIHTPANGDPSTYSGLVSAMLRDADLSITGARVAVYVGLVDSAGQIVGGRLRWRAGGIASDIKTHVQSGSATLSLQVEPRLAAAAPQTASYLTNTDQQVRHSGDLFLEFQADLARGFAGRWDPVA